MPTITDRIEALQHLSDRCWGVLRELVRQYIFDGCPVGSGTIAEVYPQRLSPASIRKVMAELEEAGLIMQPHVSAGRIPTDLGYRCYVERFLAHPRLGRDDRRAVATGLSPAGEMEEILDQASRLLSEMSHHVGVVVAPDLRRLLLRNIEFVRINSRRVLVVLVADSGRVVNRVVEVDSVPPQEDLERFARFLVAEFRGMTLPRMRDILIERMARESRAYDRLARNAMRLGLCALKQGDDDETEIFVEGTASILTLPTARDVFRMRSLMEALQQKEKIVLLLNRCLEQSGARALIGSESGDSELHDLSVIAARYRFRGQPLGIMGIIGPTRMEYGRNMALVRHIARSLSEILTEAFH